MELKKKDLKNLQNSIVECKDLQGSSFSYILVVNNSYIDEELKAVESSKTKHSEQAQNYINEQQKLIESYVKRDENNNLLTFTLDNGQQVYDFIEGSQIPMIKDLEDLEKEHVAEKEEIESINKDFENLINKEIDSKFLKLEKNDLPESITPAQLAGLYPFLVLPKQVEEK